ncbi:hypothetical protein K7R09_22345 [Serratia ureilytica]|uniref:Uncharacterized protein n=1 Tax=Serratia ureilytica TaxID=300181 RepID=A0ABU0VRH7_9GAMM|nr:hypothetical protein [Serratia ureilytica]MCU7064543.1 hypothetical protein [Serratia ureilytica]MDQ1811366.1 hypothetical protein [Serratia ureilytica]MDQ1840427.1 hypothetical protein [Serratia ureilytica]MDQ1863813.1 hypothetical protein [Serratia ureilytica]
MTERKMTGLYVFILLAWWGGWLALDAWRIENLLTDADKWAGFHRDLLWCTASAVVSAFLFIMTAEKKFAVYVLLGFLAAAVGISTAFVVGDAFIHGRFDMSLLSDAISVVGIAMVPMLPLAAFLVEMS